MVDDDAISERLGDLLEEFAARQRAGEAPSVEEYAARFPDLADEIRTLFPAASAVERLKAQRGGGTDESCRPPPSQVGDCRLLREIGRGGMGVVYEAEQVSLGRRVAVKVLLGHLLADGAHVARFEREARTAAGLHHPNIVSVYGVGEQDGLHYFVMERVEGVSLDRVLQHLARHDGSARTAEASADAALAAACRVLAGQGRGSRWAAAARLACQAADGLQHAHDHGVLHWDIKPGNLLVGSDGHVWIADFGLARGLGAAALSQPGNTGGTLRYMAPERFRGDVSVRSDIYALGLTLFEALAGQPAFVESDPPQLVRRILAHEIPDLRSLAPGIPPDLATVVGKAVAADPDQRYPSAGAFAEDLRRFLDGRPVIARPVRWTGRLWRWSRRNPLTAAAAAIAAASLLAGAGAAALGYVQTRRALDRTVIERQKAEANARLALDVLDSVFARFAPSLTLEPPQAESADSALPSAVVPAVPVLSGATADLLRELLPAYDRLAREAGDPQTVRERAMAANRRMGDVLSQLGQYGPAEDCYRRVTAALQGQGGERGELERARLLNRIGRVQAAAGDDAAARESHSQALTGLERLPDAQRQERDVQMDLAWTHLSLGTRREGDRPPGGRGGPAPERAGGMAEADAHLGQAVRILDGLLHDRPDDADALFLLALCLRERPRPPPGAEPRDPPMRSAAGAADILAQLGRDHPGVAEYQYELAETLAAVNLHQVGTEAEDLRRAETQLVQALDILEALVRRQPYVARYVTARARAHYKLAALHRRSGKWDLAERHCRTAMDELAVLASQSPDQPLCTLWAAAYTNALAEVVVRQGREVEGRRLLEQNLATLLALQATAPTLPALPGLVDQTQSRLAALTRKTR